MRPNQFGRIVFCFPYRMNSGGMPDDSKKFIAAVSKSYSGKVVLLSKGIPKDLEGYLANIENVDLNDRKKVTFFLRSLTNNDVVTFFTFSSITNILLAARIARRGCKYTVIPAWQVDDYLDWDQPFLRNVVPTIESVVKNPRVFETTAKNGVTEGEVKLRSYFRALKRKIYRKTLGKLFLKKASGIHVFSDFERKQICCLISQNGLRFASIEFGTDISERQVGDDQFPITSFSNIVFWGRVDYYYKGLDCIIDAVALAQIKGIITPFNLWICGPDYNQGYRKVNEHVKRRNLSELVHILTPEDYTSGTINILKKADFCILASRWDGYSRTLRESVSLGVPIITNNKTHFDRIVKKFSSGVIFNSEAELAEILVDVNSAAISIVKEKAQQNRRDVAHFLNWDQCGQRFVNSLHELIKLPIE